MTTTVSNSPKFPCVDCHTDCCKEYTIFVNAHEDVQKNPKNEALHF